MNITAETVLFPWGAREGLPCVALDITGEGELPTVGQLMDPLSRAARPGVTMLWLRSAPWGTYEWDKRLAEFAYALPHMGVVATGDCRTLEWSNLQNIGWVLDVTEQVAEPTTTAALQSQTIERATLFLPPVEEVIVTKIHSSNLLHPILGELAKMWQCDNGTIYVSPEQERAALVAVSSSGVFAARMRS